MLICPAATARLLTDRYGTQLLLSVAFGAAAAITGYFVAGFLPALLGADWALNAAGMIATMAGLFLAAAVCLSPRHGLIARRRPPLTEALPGRSEEHTSELQSLMRISYAVLCLKKKKKNIQRY